jgi:beta-glucuronidase
MSSLRNVKALGLLLALIAGSAWAQSATGPAPEPPVTIENVRARTGTDLSGQWHYIVDRSRLGIRKRGMQRNFAQDRPATNHPLLEYDWDTSPTMTVPGDWNSEVTEMAMYEGMVWYRRKVEAAPQPGKRYVLHFEAANYDTRVFLNGELLGRHRGGFTPFEFEVTGKLKPGSNSLVVSVDAAHGLDTIPAEDFDWQNYGGITRPVRLVEVPATFIRDYRVGLDAAGRIAFSAALDGPASAGAEVRFSLPELGRSWSAVADAEGRVSGTIPLPRKAARWSPESPQLYRLTLAAGADSVTDRIGFRTIERRGNKLFLNGQPLTLLGVSIHEEALGAKPTRVLDEAAARALLSEAKALGSNFVRLAHYPHTETMVRLADEMGLLVWSEIPVYWDIAFDSEATYAEASAMLRAMIARDMNRPSVVIWSVANETPISDSRNRFLERLIAEARAADPSRLISAAMDKMPEAGGLDDGNLILVNDPLAEHLDVLAINRYDGWYGPLTPPEVANVRWETRFDKPIILSEFGADALHGYRADPSVRWSEDYQAEIYRQYVAMTARIPNYAGMSPWILKDFRSPRRFHGRFQEYWNRKGLIDPEGRRKLAHDVLRAYYHETRGLPVEGAE